MRYGATTSLAPADVLTRARAFFGAGGELGLLEVPGPAGTAAFAGPDGGVSVSALATDGITDVTILSQEYDYWVERFLPDLR